MDDKDEYHVWSIEHQAWWKTGCWGYATQLGFAGVFSKEQAQIIVDKANVTEINEVMISVYSL